MTTADQVAQFVEHNSLAAALAAFQAELPSVSKGATGQVPGKRTYKYADLADLSAAVLPLLGKHGLSWMTMPTFDEHGRFVLQYELLHTSGESRSGTYPLPPDGDAWKIGSALTYGRRYCLSAMTGVAADEDDDGAAVQGSSYNYSTARPPRAVDTPRQPPKAGAGDPNQARAGLAHTCEQRGWDTRAVDALFTREHGVSLRECGDALAIAKFRSSLLTDPPAEFDGGEAA